MPDMEIERKFLIDSIPHDLIKSLKPTLIIQGYISTDPIEIRLRERIEIEDYFYDMTIKKTLTEEMREEVIISLSMFAFQSLWPMIKGNIIYKNRYFLENRMTIDIFVSTSPMLIVAEVEFDTLENCKNFIPPIWFGKEVTDDPRYKTRNISKYGVPRDDEDNYKKSDKIKITCKKTGEEITYISIHKKNVDYKKYFSLDKNRNIIETHREYYKGDINFISYLTCTGKELVSYPGDGWYIGMNGKPFIISTFIEELEKENKSFEITGKMIEESKYIGPFLLEKVEK